MGMTLIPLRTPPHQSEEEEGVLHYTVQDWVWLVAELRKRGVNVSDFDDCNDGKAIGEPTCRVVADYIEKEFCISRPDIFTDPKGEAFAWRSSGGFAQY